MEVIIESLNPVSELHSVLLTTGKAIHGTEVQIKFQFCLQIAEYPGVHAEAYPVTPNSVKNFESRKLYYGKQRAKMRSLLCLSMKLPEEETLKKGNILQNQGQLGAREPCQLKNVIVHGASLCP